MQKKHLLWPSSFFFLLSCFILLYILYIPFLTQLWSFHIVTNGENTTVENSKFAISFTLNGHCVLHSEFINNLAGRDVWGGEISCGHDGWMLARIFSTDNIVYTNLYDKEILHDGRMEVFRNSDNSIRAITIFDSAKGYYITFGTGKASQQTIDQLFQSIIFTEQAKY